MSNKNLLEELQDQEQTRQGNKLPQNVKPCVLRMIGSTLTRGNTFGRSEVALIIAVEMRRVGKGKEIAHRLVLSWSKKQSPPLKPLEVESAVNSAYKDEKYDYGCNNAVVVNFCPYVEDKEECPFYRQLMVNIGRRKGRHSELDFYKKGWPGVLKSSEQVLYLAIKPIEKLQKKRPGQTVVTSYRLLGNYSGVNIALVSNCLDKLQKTGLIRFKKGEPYRWKIQATEIARVIPIPKPCKNAKS